MGLFLFSLLRNHREPPFVLVGEIKPIMNFSTVRVQGILSSDARKMQSGEVLYMLDDGSGKLPIFLSLAPEAELPKQGRRVTAEGILSLGAGNTARMRVQSAEQIMLAPLLPMEEVIATQRLADITAERKGERLTVYGQVSSVWTPRPGSKAPHKITLTDPSGSLVVIHWFAPHRAVALGDVLEVRGSVDLYKSQPQLKVWEADDIRPYLTE